MSPLLSQNTWGEGIKLSIQEGFNNVIDGISGSISNAINSALARTGSFLLNGVCVFIVYFMIFTAFKIMVTINKEKQEDNFNMIGIAACVYMTIKMIAQIINVGN